MMSGPKILMVDIETAPNLAWCWGLWQQNVALSQLVKSTEMLSFASKWLGVPETEFRSVFHDGKLPMVERAHALLDEADAVMGWNSKSFDAKHLNREFLEAGLGPPSPYKHIDLMLTAKKKFKFPSNKLQYVSTLLGLAGKVQHSGFELWVRCMAGDPEAWEEMKTYNIQDTELLEDVYHKLLPWIDGHPNVNLYGPELDEKYRCPRCASANVQKRGFAYTSISAFQQYACMECGSWSRVSKRDRGSELRESA
jgi:hypothetical protein